MRTSWRKLKLVRWQVSTFTASRRRTSNKRSVVMAWTPPRERHGTLTFSSAIEIAKPLWFAHHTLLHHSVPRSKSIMILIIWHLIFQSPEFPSLKNCDNKALSYTSHQHTFKEIRVSSGSTTNKSRTAGNTAKPTHESPSHLNAMLRFPQKT